MLVNSCIKLNDFVLTVQSLVNYLVFTTCQESILIWKKANGKVCLVNTVFNRQKS